MRRPPPAGRLERDAPREPGHRRSGPDRQHLQDHGGAGRRPGRDARPRAMSAMPAMAQTFPGRYLPRLDTVQMRAAVQPRALSPRPSIILHAAISSAYIAQTVTADRMSQPGSTRQSSGWDRAHPSSAAASRPRARGWRRRRSTAPRESTGYAPSASRYHPSQIPATWSGSSRARQDSPTSRATASGRVAQERPSVASAMESADGSVRRPAPDSGTTSSTPRRPSTPLPAPRT